MIQPNIMKLRLLIITSVLNCHSVFAAPGDLDSSFGNGGIVTTAVGNGADQAHAMTPPVRSPSGIRHPPEASSAGVIASASSNGMLSSLN